MLRMTGLARPTRRAANERPPPIGTRRDAGREVLPRTKSAISGDDADLHNAGEGDIEPIGPYDFQRIPTKSLA
eukprot:6489658-Alexandrium_andersonii.AAC.1